MSIALFLLYLFLPTPAPSVPRHLPTAHLAPRVAAVKPAPAPEAVAYHPPKKLPTYHVTATVYMAVVGQTDDEPFVTADNSRISPHQTHKSRWAALSRDLLKHWGGPFDYGDSVRISGISPQLDGVYIIHDTMARRHKHCFDVLVGAKEAHLSDMWHNVRLTPVPARPAPQPEWQAG